MQSAQHINSKDVHLNIEGTKNQSSQQPPPSCQPPPYGNPPPVPIQYQQPMPMPVVYQNVPIPAMYNPFPYNHYIVSLSNSEQQSCKNCCRGTYNFNLSSADATYSNIKPLGYVEHSERTWCLGLCRDPFMAKLTIGGQTLATSQRVGQLEGVGCFTDKVQVTRGDGQPLGSVTANGNGFGFTYQTLNWTGGLDYQIEFQCDFSLSYFTYFIYDSSRRFVGEMRYDRCSCYQNQVLIELPHNATPDQRVLLMLAAHFLLIITMQNEG